MLGSALFISDAIKVKKPVVLVLSNSVTNGKMTTHHNASSQS